MIIGAVILLPLVYASSDDVIINRPLNRVEFSDLLLEYNPHYADEPRNAIEVDVALNVEQAKWSLGFSKELVLVVELYESWHDSRLKFTGDSSVTVPHGTVLWMPDTYFVNTVDAQWHPQSSVRLRHDGTIFRKRRAKTAVPCDLDLKLLLQSEHANCTLVLGSFDNAGAASISYRIAEVVFPNDVDHTIKFEPEYANSTAIVHAFNGETLLRSTIVFSVDEFVCFGSGMPPHYNLFGDTPHLIIV